MLKEGLNLIYYLDSVIVCIDRILAGENHKYLTYCFDLSDSSFFNEFLFDEHS